MLRCSQARTLWRASGLLAAAVLTAAAIAARPLALASEAPQTDFTVYDADGRHVIGHLRYLVDYEATTIKIRGESRFLNGESDVETDLLDAPPGQLPRLRTYDHGFFTSNGSPQLDTHADLRSGRAECVRYKGNQAESLAATLAFPTDTYAGASLAVPIERALGAGSADPLKIHIFSCVPGPRIFAVEATPAGPPTRWALYPGELVKVNIRPDFGLWSLLIRPFFPKLYAWFDPSSDWNYVGTAITRYYRGPQIVMVRVPPPAIHPR